MAELEAFLDRLAQAQVFSGSVLLAKDGKVDIEKGSVWGLPKVRTHFKVAGAKKAPKAEGEGVPAEGEAAAAAAPAKADAKGKPEAKGKADAKAEAKPKGKGKGKE